MIRFFFVKTSIGFLLFSLFWACNEDDLNTIGSETIGPNTFERLSFDRAQIKAYTQVTSGVQQNNLATYGLGVYNDPIYGKSVYDILGHITPGPVPPVIESNQTLDIDAIRFILPHFSTQTGQDMNGDTVTRQYKLDSIYRTQGTDELTINVFESQYFLSDLNTDNTTEPVRYFSSQEDFSLNRSLIKKGEPLFSADLSADPKEDTQIVPDGMARKDALTVVQVLPRLEVALNQQDDARLYSFVENFIRDRTILTSNGLNYDRTRLNQKFRGLYFEVASREESGILFVIDPAQLRLEVDYRIYTNIDATNKDNEAVEMEKQQAIDAAPLRRLTMSLSNLTQTLNLIDFDTNTISSRVIDQNTLTGAEKLYLKGGEGSYAIVELFSGEKNEKGIPLQLDSLRQQNLLINEANLQFFIDQSEVNTIDETLPFRIYVWNPDTGEPLVGDFARDPFTGPTVPIESRVSSHLGPFQKDSKSYTLRITDYVNDLLTLEEDDVKDRLRLGVSVISSVAFPLTFNQQTGAAIIPTNTIARAKIEGDASTVNYPVGAILSPEGTVLVGTNTKDDTRRLKLNIQYSKSNN